MSFCKPKEKWKDVMLNSDDLQIFTSRNNNLKEEFLVPMLNKATRYLRMAGYFRSSILEIIGEELKEIPEVRILCNSELEHGDFETARRSEAFLRAWNEVNPCENAWLHKERYQLLDSLLHSTNADMRVMPKEKMFLHGKAGIVRYVDGSQMAFLGSANETAAAFSPGQYEIVGCTRSERSIDTLETDFNALWREAVPLPEAVAAEIHRFAYREEVAIDSVPPENLPGAVLAESPIYRAGEQLQVWQRLFIVDFMRHRKTYGKARLLLADEVGLGKTMSLGTCAMMDAMLGDGPVLILVPAALALQWQTELLDKLGIPAAVWSTRDKAWLDADGMLLSSRNSPENVSRCPYAIGIVSTGLIMQRRRKGKFVAEAEALLSRRYGMVVLDEAHRARGAAGGSNNLLAFMMQIAPQAQHVLLGTATPIQTEMRDLWNLFGILDAGAPHVLGSQRSPWRAAVFDADGGENSAMNMASNVASGKMNIATPEEAWRWLDPFPARGELSAGSAPDRLRTSLGMDDGDFFPSGECADLPLLDVGTLSECLVEGFFQQCNPIIRHTVLRKRKDLEEAGLLSGIDVRVHPLPDQPDIAGGRFSGLGLRTEETFNRAYGHAERFCGLLRQRSSAAGFMKTILLQRLCSSVAAGIRTAKAMLMHSLDEDSRGEHDGGGDILVGMTDAEAACLRDLVAELSGMQTADPKLETVYWFLTSCLTDGRTWLEHGAIVFSQYYDTAAWIAAELAERMPEELIAVYAGAGKSHLHRNGECISVSRETVKAMIGRREIRLVVATDAACEGLNLQTLGTLVNVDLPWNPGRLEQRLGRIRRFGQERKTVDMLNLVYSGTQDEKIYSVLSRRLKDVYDLFGSIPDTLEDVWISNEETLRKQLELCLDRQKSLAMKNVFSLKYGINETDIADDWRRCSAVISRRDVLERLREPWPV